MHRGAALGSPPARARGASRPLPRCSGATLAMAPRARAADASELVAGAQRLRRAERGHAAVPRRVLCARQGVGPGDPGAFGLRGCLRWRRCCAPSCARRTGSAARYLWARVGYSHIGKASAGETQEPERHGVLAVYTRAPLPEQFWLEGRLRADLRWIGNDYSTRYRARLELSRDYSVARSAADVLCQRRSCSTTLARAASAARCTQLGTEVSGRQGLPLRDLPGLAGGPPAGAGEPAGAGAGGQVVLLVAPLHDRPTDRARIRRRIIRMSKKTESPAKRTKRSVTGCRARDRQRPTCRPASAGPRARPCATRCRARRTPAGRRPRTAATRWNC